MKQSFAKTEWIGEEWPIRKIEADPKQIRSGITPKSVEELAESVAKLGVVVPLVGFRVGEFVRLIAGHRRLLAAKLAGLKCVPVVIRAKKPGDALAGQIVENLAREDMSVADTCAALKRLQKEGGYSQSVVAKICGRSEAWVSINLAYDRYPRLLREAVDAGHVPLSAARYLVQIKEPRYLQSALAAAIDQGMTESQAKAWLRNAESEQLSLSGSSAERGVPDHIDPDRHKATCGVCGKRKAWAEVQQVTVCGSCIKGGTA